MQTDFSISFKHTLTENATSSTMRISTAELNACKVDILHTNVVPFVFLRPNHSSAKQKYQCITTCYLNCSQTQNG